MSDLLQETPDSDESVEEAQESIVETFEFFDDWTERYQYIIQLGRQMPPFPEAAQTEDNRIHGCQSKVWLTTDYREGKLNFEATSDSAIVAGLIALLLQVYSGRTPQEILGASNGFIDRIGLAQHLSPNRANGLSNMLARIRTIAGNHALDNPAASGA